MTRLFIYLLVIWFFYKYIYICAFVILSKHKKKKLYKIFVYITN